MRKTPAPLPLLFTALLLTACATSTPPLRIDERKPAPLPTSVEKPILQIDSGGHQAKIKDIFFSRDGKQLISASNDKTVRIWDLASGETVRILRGQIGVGPEGKIYAAALSPDGRLLAVGGYTKNDEIRLIDLQTGKLLRLLKGHGDVVLGLTFSADGRLLSGSADKTARIWDVASGRSLLTLKGHDDFIYAVAFSPDGERVVTGSDDDTLKLWHSRSGDLLAELVGHTDKVRSVAFTADGETILSGSWDKTIRLWQGRSGRFIKTLARQASTVDSLTLSPDGTKVVTGAGYGNNQNNVFAIPSGEKLTSFKQHDNIVLATAISADGRLAATGGGDDNEIALWDINSGQLKKRLVGRGGQVWSVGFANDGRSIAWGKKSLTTATWNRGMLEQSFQLKEGPDLFSLTMAEAVVNARQSSFQRAIESLGDLSITTENGKIDPTLLIKKGGQVVHKITRHSTTGFRHRSLTLTPDGSAVISGGGNGVLTAYSTKTGNKSHDFVGHTGDVWGVAVSPEGRYLVSGSSDQTVKLWRVDSGQLLLTIFHGSDGEWVAWTPEGFYTASPNGDAYVGYQINRGEDRAADYVGLDQIGELFYRPDLVAKTVQGGFEREIAAELARIGTIDKIIADGPPPEIRLLSEGGQTARERSFTLRLAVRALKGGIGEVRYRVNGVEVAAARARGEVPPSLRRSGVIEEGEVVIVKPLTLPDGDNEVAVSICNSENTICSREVRLSRHVDDPRSRQPSLHLLAIGISDYRDRALQLTFADKDATALSRRLQRQGRGLYKEIHVTTLLNREATTQKIEQAFEQIAAQVEPNDLFLLYLAGHGMAQHGEYHFVPQEAVYENSAAFAEASLSQQELERLLKKVPTSKSLLLLDSCSSGLFATAMAGNKQLASLSRGIEEKSAIDRLMRATGRTVLAATTDRAQALEGYNGHGVFTWALLEGLRGRADRKGRGEGSIAIDELADFVREEVPRITQERWGFEQIPMRMMQGDPFPISCIEGYDRAGCRK